MKLTKSKRINYLLSNYGIDSYYDVLKNYPYKYINLTPSDEEQLKNNQKIVLRGKVLGDIEEIDDKTKKIITFQFKSNSNYIYSVIVFNRSYFNNDQTKKKELILVGIYKKSNNQIEVINIYSADIDLLFRPIYHLPQGISPKTYNLLVSKAFESFENKLINYIPSSLLNKYKLINKKEAIKRLHFPKNKSEIQDAYKYLKYEEALCNSLESLINFHEKNVEFVKRDILITHKELNAFINNLKFKLTSDQLHVIKEIVHDMNSPYLMNRLLQGDVGCGKTIVATCALYANSLRKKLGVLMAPTDVLAQQHYTKIKETLNSYNIAIRLLTGSVRLSQCLSIKREIADGKIDILIGTQSVLNDQINYNNLGLVIIDEQHRFGVKQRKSLLFKGNLVDFLMMTATPIPRTLALSRYGKIDVSSISQYPSGCRKIETKILKSYDKEIFNKIDEMILKNRQVYIIVPKIVSDTLSDFSIDNLSILYGLKYKGKLGILNGKMIANEKEEILKKFYNHEIDILLSTTVIEVGIDVKLASLLVIYGANYFGLATLHQLRGRIGRDGFKSYCFLIYDGNDYKTMNKLKMMTNTSDGLELSNFDMKQRGEGDIDGEIQSGHNSYKLLDSTKDKKIFELANEDAKQIYKNKTLVENKPIIEYVRFFISRKSE